MNRASVRLLLAPVFLLAAAAGCRDEATGTPTQDLAAPAPDLAGTAPGDLAQPADLTAPPADMTGGPVLPTELMVVRVGDGTAALSSDSVATFIERRKISDGSLVGNVLAMPTAVAGANKRLTLSGSATSEGGLSRSADGKYVLLGGYDAMPGTASVPTTSSATVNRVIGRIDGAGAIDTSTAFDYFSTDNIRSATSTDGKALWAAGTTGAAYTTLGSTAKPVSLTTVNMRWVNLFGGQLYASSSAGTNNGISAIGTGTPMTAAAPTLLTGFAAQSSVSHYGFVALDRDGQNGIDTIYVADDHAAASGGGVQRWTLSGGTWKLDGTLAKGLTAGARGVAGFMSGTSVVVIASTSETTTRVVSFTDDGTALDMITAKELAKAATNTAFRGVALAPQ